MNEKTPINSEKKDKKGDKKKKKGKGGKKDKKNKKDLEKEEEEKEDDASSESSEEERGCCQRLGDCIRYIFFSCVKCVRSCCIGFKKCCGKTIYPFKERCCLCLNRVDNRLNPYKDPGYSEI